MTRQLSLWLAWVLASAGGGAYFGAMMDNEDLFGYFALPGLVVGVAQWLVLRRHLPNAGWWIPASALGWILGSFVFVTIDGIIDRINGSTTIRHPNWIASNPVVYFAMYCAALGSAQWLVLRGQTQGASWWVFASAVGGALSSVVVGAFPSLPFGNAQFESALICSAFCAVHGAVTGLALVWLLL